MGVLSIPYAYLASPSRQISTIIPDIVTREIHTDQTVITRHPVETGAAVSDHAYLQPSQVEMHCRFSNSTAQSEGYVQIVYNQFLALRATLTPFNVSTGKRAYQNMLVSEITVTTDEFTEYVLDVVVRLEQVNITSAQQGTIPANASSDPSAQASPQQTATPQNLGTQQLTATPAGPTTATATSSSFNSAGPYGDLSGISFGSNNGAYAPSGM
jgi:hypothetical protein